MKVLGNIKQIELQLLLEAIYQRYGYDFRDYAPESLERRVAVAMEKEGVSNLSSYQSKILHDPSSLDRFVGALAIHFTSMYRDPDFYLAFRRKLIPLLRTYAYIRIWVAGCSSGEEIYSLAILMHEEGLYNRCRIYATDIADSVLKAAKDGIYPLSKMKEFTRNYQLAGGEQDFSQYYTAKYVSAIFRKSLLDNVTLAQHNLVSDASFNEFNVIICRNVMIYFNRELQNRVVRLFHDSLCRFGVLGIGLQETMAYTGLEQYYSEIEHNSRIYRRKY